jgi:DNA invertase Pin-like site-specific DNA recombinase
MKEVGCSYRRVSSDEQARRGTSIPEQGQRIAATAEREGVPVEFEIVDDGISGRTMYRPGIAEVTQLAQAGAFQVLYADEITRLHRCDAEFEIWVKSVLVPAGIRIVLAQGQYNAGDDPDAWLAGKVPSIMGDYSSKRLSKRLKQAAHAKSESGKLVSGRPFATKRNPLAADPNRPAGYIQRVRDEELYPVLIEIFQRCKAGEPYRSIAMDLTRRNISTVDGGRWHSVTVKSIVSCLWYIGVIVHRGKPVLDEEGNPKVFPHDCMVPLDLWQAAQPQARPKAGKLERQFILNGLVVSSHFEQVRPAAHAGEPAPYRQRDAGKRGKHSWKYTRQDAINRDYYEVKAADAGAELMPSSLDAEELEAVVLDRLVEVVSGDELLDRALRSGEADADAAVDAKERLTKQLQKAQLDYSTAQRNAAAAVEAGLMEAAEVLDAKAASARKLADRIAAELALTSAQLEPVTEAEILHRINLLREARRHGLIEEMARLVRELVEVIDVRIDGVHITLRSGGGRKGLIQKGRGSSLRRAGSGRGRSGSASRARSSPRRPPAAGAGSPAACD